MSLKKLDNLFESLISNSFDELHCTPIVHMNHIEPMFQELLNQEGSKKAQ